MSATLFGNVLVPVDFGELSAHALRYAAAMAKCSGAKVSAMYAHTFSPPAYFTASRVAEMAKQYRDSFEDARRSLGEFVTTALGDAASGVSTHVVEGLPADAVAKFAAESGAGLIVMGTHGRNGLNRWMLGSVTERVLRESRIPVLTIRQGVAASAAPLEIRNILCPVNNSPIARESLRIAIGLAACFGATVTALHVSESGSKDSIRDLCSWVEEQKRAGCSIQEITRKGDAATEIVSAAAETGCDLAVIGAHHRTFFDSTVLGTTTVRVVRHARCPVLTVAAAS